MPKALHMARYLRRWPKSVELAERTQKGILSSALVVHEFKAPLVDLQTFIQNIGLNEQQPLILRALSERLDDLHRLIDQLLITAPNLARPSNEWTDPDDLLCTLTAHLTAPAMSKRLQIRYQCAFKSACEFFTQTFAFELLARNLITNAIKHSPQGSIDIVLDECESGLTIRISDCGGGLNQTTSAFLQGQLSYEQYHTDIQHGIGMLLARSAADQLVAKIRINDRFAEAGSEPWVSAHAPLGTVIEVFIPGQWRCKQTQEVGKVADTAALEVVADLSALYTTAPELCQRLTASGFKHDSNTALKLNLSTDVYPHIVCTLNEVNIEHAAYPCSAKRLREMVQNIAKISETAVMHTLTTAPQQLPQKQHRQSHQIEAAAPTAQNQAEKLAPTQSQPSRLALVIDDSVLSRMHIGRLLNNRGWMMVEADSHNIGTRAQHRCQFDLIIEDACLPGVAGRNEVSDTMKVAISADRDLAEGLTRGPGHWLDALVKPVDAQAFERMLVSWQTAPPTPIWDLQLAKIRLGGGDALAFDGGAEMLSDCLRNWSKLVRSSRQGDALGEKQILHRLCGGLLYSGFPALQQCTDTLHRQVSGGTQISAADLVSLGRILRQTITLFKAQPGQNKKLRSTLQPIKF